MVPRHTRATERDRSRRVLSQNFLVDPAAVDRLIRAARPDPNRLLLEVGAGRGQLTRLLAARSRRLIAYEVDPVAGAELARTCADLPTVTCRRADFLTAPPPRVPYDVVGNIPWSLTSAVVRWCLAASGLRAATLLTQLEYARKRSGAYGRWTRLTVLNWPEFSWRLAGRVPRTAFRPVPRVNAGILRIERRREPLLPGAVSAVLPGPAPRPQQAEQHQPLLRPDVTDRGGRIETGRAQGRGQPCPRIASAQRRRE